MPSAQFENEAMNCGERKVSRDRTDRFAMIGVDLYQASPDDLEHVNDPVRGDYELVIVDVTDPTSPHVRSRVTATTSTHTVTCIDGTDCRYAYSAGDDSEVPGTGQLLGVRPHRPRPPGRGRQRPGHAGHPAVPLRRRRLGRAQVERRRRRATPPTPARAGRTSTTSRDPLHPVEVANTGAAGDSAREGSVNHYNDFIHHNSFRPNAKAFRPDAPPSLANGNILLVTEEDYEDPDCSTAGSFQTWHVKRLDGSDGSIVPLAKVELADLGTYPDARPARSAPRTGSTTTPAASSRSASTAAAPSSSTSPTRPRRPATATRRGAPPRCGTRCGPRSTTARASRTSQRTNLVYSVDLVRGSTCTSSTCPGTGSAPCPRSRSPSSVAVAPGVVVGGSAVLALLLHRRRRRA